MTDWKSKVKIRHLFTEHEDYENVQKSMNEIADVLEATPAFKYFDTKKFREIKKGDEILGPVDYANKLITRMYDYADDNLIWVD